MGLSPSIDSGDVLGRLERAIRGDQAAWQDLLGRYRDRLRRMAALRLDQRLRGRVDPSDVIQEAYLEAWTRLPEYARDPSMPLFLWLRFLTGQQLQTAHRRHLGAQARDAGRDVSIYRGTMPEASSEALAARLLGRDTPASEALILAERRQRLQQALEAMSPMDREILALRHFEQLSNGEAARVLEISEGAATKRYLRALERLRGLLVESDGGASDLWP
jgi:RNA polymerase sigma-70 factor (ECF subfamily)